MNYDKFITYCLYIHLYMTNINEILRANSEEIEKLDRNALKEFYRNRPRCKFPSPYLRGKQPIEWFLNSDRTLGKEFLKGFFYSYSTISIQSGGWYRPRECRPLSPMALIIPYRARDNLNLPFFLQFIHPFLQRQQLAYRIFVIEQRDEQKFNKGLLNNIAYVEALKFNDYKCFVFHDLDLIPLDDRFIYHCDPRLSPGRVNSNMGGVVALETDTYRKLNGWSNYFWGWGPEDQELKKRIYKNMKNLPSKIIRSDYFHLYHKRLATNYNVLQDDIYYRSELLQLGRDGLRTLPAMKFKKAVIERKMFTHIIVNLTHAQNYLSFDTQTLVHLEELLQGNITKA